MYLYELFYCILNWSLQQIVPVLEALYKQFDLNSAIRLAIVYSIKEDTVESLSVDFPVQINLLVVEPKFFGCQNNLVIQKHFYCNLLL